VSGTIPAVISGANFSDDGRHRYSLYRCWDPSTESLPFIMCNPSTADASTDDPTIRRCVGFAKSHGYGGIIVRNLYAWRATSPKDLNAARRAGEDIIGPENAEWLAGLLPLARPVVAAWGALGALRSSAADRAPTDAYVDTVVDMFAGCLFRLDARKSVAAPHPLYLPSTARLVAYGLGQP